MEVKKGWEPQWRVEAKKRIEAHWEMEAKVRRPKKKRLSGAGGSKRVRYSMGSGKKGGNL